MPDFGLSAHPTLRHLSTKVTKSASISLLRLILLSNLGTGALWRYTPRLD